MDYKIKATETPLLCDNTSAIAIAHNPVHHAKSKHISVRHHFIRDHVEKKDILLEYVQTENQLADIFTKPLCEDRFKTLCLKLGLIDFDATIGAS